MKPEPCPIQWCEETGVHDEHRAYLGSWVVETMDSRFPSTVQVLVTSPTPSQPRAALVIVDAHLRQAGAVLSWPEVDVIAGALVDARRGFG